MKKSFVMLVALAALILLAPAHAETAAVTAEPLAALDLGGEIGTCGASSPSLPVAPLVEAFGYGGDYACVHPGLCSFSGNPCAPPYQCAVPRVNGCCYIDQIQCAAGCTPGCGALCAGEP